MDHKWYAWQVWLDQECSACGAKRVGNHPEMCSGVREPAPEIKVLKKKKVKKKKK